MPCTVWMVIRDASKSALRCSAFWIFSDFGKLNRRVHPDQVGDARDPVRFVDCDLGFGLLERPVNIAGQGDDPLLDL